MKKITIENFMKMEVTLNKLYDSNSLKIKEAYWVKRAVDKFKTLKSSVNDMRVKLYKKYGVKGKEGDTVLDGNFKLKAEQEFYNFVQEEFEINLDIDYNDLKNVKLSPLDYYLLNGFIYNMPENIKTDTKEIKILELFDVYTFLGKIFQYDGFSQEKAYKINLDINTVEECVKKISDINNRLIDKWGKTDEETGEMFIPKEKIGEANSEYVDLLKGEEVNIRMNFVLDELENVGLSPKDLDKLGFFINVGESNA